MAWQRGRPARIAGAVAFLVGALVAGPAAPAALADQDAWRAAPSGQAPCPAGLTRSSTVTAQSFESGIPQPRFNNGFTRSGAGGAFSGSWFARSDLDGTGSDDTNFFFLDYEHVDPGTRTFLGYVTRGSFRTGSVVVVANSVVATPTASPGWTGGLVDITAATRDEGGHVGVYVEHDRVAGSDTSLQVDDVQVFTCAGPPASGVRGDWTGDGQVDLLATDTDGDLWLYPGRGDGRVGSARQVGRGWTAMTWIGSPGDVDGDRRTDLVARRDDGTFWLYRGRGTGSFAAPEQVGHGWNVMSAIATPGDVDRDGRPDLLARREDGTLHRYPFRTDGGLTHAGQVGHGWNGMTWIVGMGDMTGDGRGDAVGVHENGYLYGYRSTAAGGLAGLGRIGHGWTGMTWLTSPGDLDGDGLGDLLGRHSNGTLWLYRGRPGGGVTGGEQIGHGWNVMERLI